MPSRKPKPAINTSQLRIIGGQWRSRKLDFAAVEGLRPTPDRVRETLFNWLQHSIAGAHCLDIFAGSGALGLEALSRGAEHCTFIDLASAPCQHLRDNCKKLDCQRANIVQADAQQWLEQQRPQAAAFDVIFLDPPFNKNLLAPMCERIEALGLLKEGGYIYTECERTLQVHLPWKLHREKTAGQVRYALWQRDSSAQ
ncbi:MAG: 16S rRNA (guanine(966)-N(2))-methyltransferase RsmD [Pseudomonadales bacterium]